MQPKSAATVRMPASQEMPPTLTASLVQAWLGGESQLGNLLDLFAYEEAAVVQDEAAEEGAGEGREGGMVQAAIHDMCGECTDLPTMTTAHIVNESFTDLVLMDS